MKISLPKATNPPKLVKPYGVLLGYISTVISVVFAVVHLFRIDTLIPVVDATIASGIGLAVIFVVMVIVAEVFSIPFLFRMKLSPLAHLLSGFFAILAPLMWTLLTIWAYSVDGQTGQLNSIVETPATWWLIALNVAWLAFNYLTIWTLGYNNLKLKDILKK